MKNALTRRELLSTLGTSGLVLGLSGCGGSSSNTPRPAPTPTPGSTPTPTPAPTPTPTPSPGSRAERLGYAEIEGSSSYIASVRIDGSDYRRVPIPPQDGGITWMDWSRDGKRIVFQLEKGGDTLLNKRLYLVNADGTNLRYFRNGWYPTWHADGKRIAFVNYARSEKAVWSEVYAVDIEGDMGINLLEPPEESPVRIFYRGTVLPWEHRYTHPRWIADTSDDVLVNLVKNHGDGTMETIIEHYRSGAAVHTGRTNDKAVGDIVSLGRVAPDGTYTYGKTVLTSPTDRRDFGYLRRNGVTEPLAYGISLFSPDSQRILRDISAPGYFGPGITAIGGTEYTKVSVNRIIYSWFYE